MRWPPGPFCDCLNLRMPKPRRALPLQLNSVGDHIRKCRISRGKTQAEAAEEIGTEDFNIINWEKGRPIRPEYFPGIVRFLGYNPLPESESLADRVRRERLSRGWTRLRLASAAHVRPDTVRRIEDDGRKLASWTIARVCKALGLSEAKSEARDH